MSAAATKETRAVETPPPTDLAEALFALLAAAARAGEQAPGQETLARELRRAKTAITAALDMLTLEGRIEPFGARNHRRYRLPALGLVTAVRPAARNAASRDGDEAALTETQREALVAVRDLVLARGGARAEDVAQRLGIGTAAAQDRLNRVAARKLLERLPDGRYRPPRGPSKAGPAQPEARVEWRDGVKVTVCPPRFAAGAITFRPWGRS